MPRCRDGPPDKDRSGAILRAMPDAQDRHHVLVFEAVDDDVGEHHDQLAGSNLATGPAAAREHHQAVAGEQQFATNLPRGNRVFGRNVAYDPADIGQRLGAPDDGHRSVRLGRRCVKLALGEPQQPCTDLFMRRGTRVSVGLGDRGGQCARLIFGLVVLDQRCRLAHG